MTITELMTKHGITATDPQAMTAFLQDVRAHDFMPEYTVEEFVDLIVKDLEAEITGYAVNSGNIRDSHRMFSMALVKRLNKSEKILGFRSMKI